MYLLNCWYLCCMTTILLMRVVHRWGIRHLYSYILTRMRGLAGIMYKEGEEPAEGEGPRWWEVLQETAQQAGGCEEELGDIMTRTYHLLRDFGRCLAWLAICWELLIMSGVSAFTLAITPLIHGLSLSGAQIPFVYTPVGVPGLGGTVLSAVFLPPFHVFFGGGGGGVWGRH